MAILKCKMCGGDIKAKKDEAYGICESCGSTSTLPKASDEKTVNLFNRANHFRRLNDFDKALSAYESIFNEDNVNAEAHWCAVLCRYGIEYVEDPRTHERIPTCHRVQFESILSDPDYLSALEHAADEYTKSLYEEEAKKISEIQKGILAISNKEEPYDVFICYKETTDGGSRTKDSTIAQDIYYQLNNDGYRVFFAKITLEDKLGLEYEPYIFSALNSAKVMLVIGTCKEHFEAVWVKNEWSRFLAIMKKDRSRLLIPCYRDMNAYDIPDELSNLQAQDLGKIGFLQDLIRGIKKVIEEGKISHVEQVSTSAVIPQKFANLTLEKERENWEKKIDDIERNKIELERMLDWANDCLNRSQDYFAQCRDNERRDLEKQEREQQEKERMAHYSGDWRDLMAANVGRMYAGINPAAKFVEKAQQQVCQDKERITSLKNSIAECNRIVASYKTQLRSLDLLLQKAPEQRVEDHYRRLLAEKNAKSDIEGLPELAKQFREMEEYKDTAALADECENLVFKISYDRLVDAMNKATTEIEYQNLAKKFRDMNGYTNTSELAGECENAAVKARYNQLVQAKTKASTEGEYQYLAEQFRNMNGYADTVELAIECDKQYRVLKERSEKQERVEQERRKEQERRDREERERRETDQRERWRIEELERKAKEHRHKVGRIAAVLFAVFSFIMVFVLVAVINDISVIPLSIITIIIPFLIVFFSSTYHMKRFYIFLIVGIAFNLLIMGVCVDASSNDAGIFIAIVMCISSLLSFTLATAFQKKE